MTKAISAVGLGAYTISRRSYLLGLGILFVVMWTSLAIAPFDRAAWMLENSLVAVLAVLLALSYRTFPLTRLSYTLIFIFLCLHEIGAHYTYAKVPYDDWLYSLFGWRTGLERNYFDRVVHFCYGLLIAYPIRELFIRIANVRGFWGYFLPLDLTISTSALFELIEWGVAVTFGSDVGTAYLATQGDPWDSHKDMACASLGALVTMTLVAAVNRYKQRDFAAEWADSLRVKRRRPE